MTTTETASTETSSPSNTGGGEVSRLNRLLDTYKVAFAFLIDAKSGLESRVSRNGDTRPLAITLSDNAGLPNTRVVVRLGKDGAIRLSSNWARTAMAVSASASAGEDEAGNPRPVRLHHRVAGAVAFAWTYLFGGRVARRFYRHTPLILVSADAKRRGINVRDYIADA